LTKARQRRIILTGSPEGRRGKRRASDTENHKAKGERRKLKWQSEPFMKNTFKKSTKLYNVAAIVSFMAALLGVLLSLVFWEATGWELFRCSGLVSLFTAVAAGMTAFLEQSVNQLLRGWAYANGKGWGFFGQEEPVIPASFLGRFLFVGNWHNFHVGNANITRSCNYHAHSNARSHRRASRSSFTRASNSTGGTSDDGDSGDPDPDDQLDLNTPSKLHHCTKKTNRNQLPGRIRQYRRVPNRACSERGRLA
jgi:hypothetical protein